ncbi:MAG: hypothetical protein ACRDF4_08445 [Rhabdochlamydiaceae bacterium]
MSASTGSILREFKNIEHSVADGIDVLAHVPQEKLKQFMVATYTEATNAAFLYRRAQSMMEDADPLGFTEKVIITGPHGEQSIKEVPITYNRGKRLKEQLDFYFEFKIAMNGRSRAQVEGVTTSFGAGAQQERQGLLSRVGGWIRGKI